MDKVALNVGDLATMPTFYIGDGKPPKKKNTIKIKKMIIADPGIALEVAFE